MDEKASLDHNHQPTYYSKDSILGNRPMCCYGLTQRACEFILCHIKYNKLPFLCSNPCGVRGIRMTQRLWFICVLYHVTVKITWHRLKTYDVNQINPSTARTTHYGLSCRVFLWRTHTRCLSANASIHQNFTGRNMWKEHKPLDNCHATLAISPMTVHQVL
jgi:hypothetical protein